MNAIALSLLAAIFIWGSNNAATKYLVQSWPPLFIGFTRFFGAGVILLGLLRIMPRLGPIHTLDAPLRKRLWWEGSVNLGLYIISFNLALAYTSASHVALYMGAAPVWALVAEGRPRMTWVSLKAYGAALLALAGVVILFWPALHAGGTVWVGELIGLACSVFWTHYGRHCRAFRDVLSSAEISAHTFVRGSLLVAPFALVEAVLYFRQHGISPLLDPKLIGIQTYSTLFSGVLAFLIWNNALRVWPVSKVYLFNNLIPLSTMLWAHFLINEPITATFWPAMGLIIGGVLMGQTRWEAVLGKRFFPGE